MSHELDLAALLHPQLRDECMSRFSHGLFIDAARQAMALVEDELRRKGGCTSTLYGTSLVDHVFGKKDPLRLRTVLDPDQHQKAQKLFIGAFEYYRNFLMHHSAGIDCGKCITIMVVASELMYLVGAGAYVFRGEETLQHLLRTGQVASARELGSLLQFLDEYWVPDEAFDGLFETLAYNQISNDAYEVVHELGLVDWSRQDVDADDLTEGAIQTDFIDTAHLTEDGKEMLRLCQNAQPYGDLDTLRSPWDVFGWPGKANPPTE